MKFGVSQCAKLHTRAEKLTSRERLQIGSSKAECLDAEPAEYYKFFGIEECNGQLDDDMKKNE